MVLGNSFIILGLILLLPLIPIYFYREYLFKKFYQRSGVQAMIMDIKIYLSNNYSKISFNYDIVNQSAIIKDLKTREAAIIEDLVLQFARYEYNTKTQQVIPKENLWVTYEQNCKPANKKAPSDLSKRKEVALRRNKSKCDRCGTPLNLKLANILFVKPLVKGGTYSLENITVVCSDCQRLISNNDPEKIALDLQISENLFKKSLTNCKDF